MPSVRTTEQGGMCMLGGIYTEEKCALCGTRMVDNHRDAVSCPKHRNQKAHNLLIRFGRQFRKRCTNYDLACRILTGIRFKYDEGSYDPRDYEISNPLGLEKQIERYLEIKEVTLKYGSLKSIRPHVSRIQKHFGSTNVKIIGYAEIEDFLLQQADIGDKTKHCLCSVLHDFFSWLVKRKIIKHEQFPEFPTIRFKLGMRKVITKDVQSQILNELRRITPSIPRIYIGALWLCTYINLRPSELRGILEEHIDYERGVVYIHSHKTERVDSKPKLITLLPEDMEAVKTLPRGFPKMHFFRHDRAAGGQKAGTRFGKDLIYKKWVRACRNLGIEGVDLYGGSRHSSSSALREYLSFEDTKQLLGDETNAAAIRYIQQDIEALRAGYALTRTWNTNGPPEIDRKRNK
jgi:integrase